MAKTSVILKMLDPKMLPRAIWVFPFLAAKTLVTNSGNEVPKATANNEMKALENPNPVAIDMALEIK